MSSHIQFTMHTSLYIHLPRVFLCARFSSQKSPYVLLCPPHVHICLSRNIHRAHLHAVSHAHVAPMSFHVYNALCTQVLPIHASSCIHVLSHGSQGTGHFCVAEGLLSGCVCWWVCPSQAEPQALSFQAAAPTSTLPCVSARSLHTECGRWLQVSPSHLCVAASSSAFTVRARVIPVLFRAIDTDHSCCHVAVQQDTRGFSFAIAQSPLLHHTLSFSVSDYHHPVSLSALVASLCIRREPQSHPRKQWFYPSLSGHSACFSNTNTCV